MSFHSEFDQKQRQRNCKECSYRHSSELCESPGSSSREFALIPAMAWPHFMTSTFPPSSNSDAALKPSIYFLNAAADLPVKNGFQSEVTNDLLLRNLYEGEIACPDDEVSGGSKGSAGDRSGFGEVTLEDYLTKSRSAREDVSDRIGGQMDLEESEIQVAGIGEGTVAGGGGEKGRGRKRLAADSTDRAALQRQKRMIKNRESAARSRERKQQYTNQLEQTVFKLEEENALLIKERDELLEWRFKQLASENGNPVSEHQQLRKSLRRINSFP